MIQRLCGIGLIAIIAVLALVGIGPKIAHEFGYETLAVTSGSMSPKIGTGSMIVVEQVTPEQSTHLKEGQIITFRRPGQESQLVTHRIYSVLGQPDQPMFATKGDANGIIDTWSVAPSDVVGTVSLHLPVAGYADAFLTNWQVRVGIIALLGLYGFTTRADEKDEGADQMVPEAA